MYVCVQVWVHMCAHWECVSVLQHTQVLLTWTLMFIGEKNLEEKGRGGEKNKKEEEQ